MAGGQTSEACSSPKKRAWRSPRLEKLGNLRDFVRTGHAFGKSGPDTDGASDPGGEMMDRS